MCIRDRGDSAADGSCPENGAGPAMAIAEASEERIERQVHCIDNSGEDEEPAQLPSQAIGEECWEEHCHCVGRNGVDGADVGNKTSATISTQQLEALTQGLLYVFWVGNKGVAATAFFNAQ